MKRSDSAPAKWSSPVGVAPYTSWHASFSAGCSDTCACSGHPRSSRERGDDRGRLGPDRAQAVDRGADLHAGPVLEQLDALRPQRNVGVEEPSLHRIGVEPAVEVAGVEQRQADPDLASGLDHRRPERVGILVGHAAGPMMDVVELADQRDPG